MCSFGALLQGETSSSMCKSPTMIDNVANTNKIVHQSVVGSCSGIATALRDRKSYVIPQQPNRSLPVHPAPQHTHCRPTTNNNIIGKSSSSLLRPSATFVPTSLVLQLHETSETCKGSSKENDETSKRPEEKKEEETTKYQAGEQEKMKKNSVNNQNIVTTSNYHLMDTISSPERIDLSHDTGSDDVTIFPSNHVDSSTIANSEKRKRRKKINKGINETVLDSGGLITLENDIEKSKTVPPLRLKKIQSLREPGISSFVTNWKKRTICETSKEIVGNLTTGQSSWNNENICDIGNLKNASKYRIVTGQTPPYEERRVDLTAPSDLSCADSLEEAKLTYKKRKLRVKLRELRRKTMELGKEMLRTVLTSSTGPRGVRENRIRQTINRYEDQIENLEKLLNELPKSVEVRRYIEEKSVNVDWQVYEISPMDNETRNCERLVPPVRTFPSSNSSSLSSSPSLEPPKLSPRSPTNYELARSPSELRNSPPILPRIYVTIPDCTNNSWHESNNSQTRIPGNERIERIDFSETKKESISRISTSPSTTTIIPITENIVKEKLDIIEESIENSHNNENLLDVGKNDFDSLSCNSLDILEVYEEPANTIESKDLIDNSKDLKLLSKISSSSPQIPIDITKNDVYETKSDLPKDIDEINEIVNRGNVESSNCNLSSIVCESKEETGQKELSKEIVTVSDDIVEEKKENGTSMSEQFPTLGNWIARLSKKQTNKVEKSNAQLPTQSPAAVEPSIAFQIYNPLPPVKLTTPEVIGNTVKAVVEENVAASQWRNNERWQEQSTNQQHQREQQQQQQQQQEHQQQQQPLSQTYSTSNTVPLPPPPVQPPGLGQEFCSPIALARFYTRNYTVDPYSMAYGYNPALAAAAASASLWNSAAILQYPLIRPNSSILNAQQQQRLSSGNIQFPGASNVSAQRPPYRFSVSQQNEAAKRPNNHENSMNYGQRDTSTKLIPPQMSNRYDHAKRTNSDYQHVVAAAAAAASQSRIAGNSVNGKSVNYRNSLQQHQQQSPQDYFGRSSYTDSTMMSRFPVPRVSWRTGHVLGPMANNDYNYSPTNSNVWSTSSGNILNSVGRTPMPSYVTGTGNVLTMNSSRPRVTKETVLSNFRNCDTPNLGKVNYSPNTLNNLECSNCGLAGSMFKCLGCEVAFYCDENCQARHWSHHVISCPKKMPKLKKLVH